MSYANWLPTVIAELDALGDLEANWDSYGALPIDPVSIEYAARLANLLAERKGIREPAVGATPDGHAGLSWDGGSWSLDVDVTPDGLWEYVIFVKGARDIEGSTDDPSIFVAVLTEGIVDEWRQTEVD